MAGRALAAALVALAVAIIIAWAVTEVFRVPSVQTAGFIGVVIGVICGVGIVIATLRR